MPTLAEHNARLRKAGLPTVETLTTRILRVFDRATSADVESGATWYDEARELAFHLGRNSGYGLEHAAAAISHLSPRTTWTRNVSGAISLLIYGEQAEGIIGANFRRAHDSLDFEDVETSFGGPKTLRFFRNIIGDTEAVTVDVWAARVVGADEAQLARVGVYDAIELAFQRAARRRGVEPTTMQATTWIVARNGRAS
jgi:hypothetical protein